MNKKTRKIITWVMLGIMIFSAIAVAVSQLIS